MKTASLLGIFSLGLCLPIFAACGEGTEMGNTGGAPATGGVGAAATGGVGVGGTAPGGSASGGASAGVGNAAGVGPAGGVGGAATGGALSGGTGGSGAVGGVATGGTGGSTSGAAGSGASGSAGSGAGGSAGSGTGGSAGSGTGGSGGMVSCTITATHSRSSAIATVEIVTFTTTLTGLTSARIDFGPAGAAPTMSAPVDLMAPNYRTVLLGMKGGREYAFRVVATSAAGSCMSQEYTLTTGAVPSNVPRITRTVMNATAQDRGFIITSGGVSGSQPAYIFDADGDVVWWASAPNSTSRARMSYDGKDMYMMALNVQNNGGEMRKVSMDGMTAMNNLSGLSTGHHDFTVLPDNGIAVIVWQGGCTAIVERSASGQLTTVVANVGTIYQTVADCHTNAINYYASDQTYTLSDRNVNAFVKIRRNGQLVWQFGGSNPRGQAFTGSMSWQVNHGHHLLSDGTFLFLNNGPQTGGNAAALVYNLNTTNWTVTKASWEYRPGVSSPVLSDVQRLPNGNTLVTFSTAGQIHEVSPSGQLVVRFQSSSNSFGYAEFRKTLYGPPLR
ncbi:MAG TPA: aryl-sulfate sulfotransferase [Polyangiaceae bacterium]